MKTRVSAPTTANPLVPVKPVSQRTLAIASGPGIARAHEVADDQPVELLGLEQLDEPVGATVAAHAPSSRFEQLERLAIAVGALAGDGAEHQPLEHRVAPPLLARTDVGEVDLDRGHAGDLERVADRVAVVRPGAGVEQRRVGELRETMQVLDELRLAVGVKEARLQAELVSVTVDPALELVQRQVAVVLARAPAEHVQVDAVQDRDPVVGRWTHPRCSSSTAALTLSGSTRWPTTGSPGRSSRTKPTPSAVRFLSRSSAARTASTSTARVEVDRQAVRAQDLGDLAAQLVGAGEPQGREQAEADRLAVAVAPVAARRLDRVADGVAEVEHLAPARRRARRRRRPRAWSARRRRSRRRGCSGSSFSIARTCSHSGSPAISAVFSTSTNPAASSASGSVASVAGSASTAAGWW